jgi:hypothetical protein
MNFMETMKMKKLLATTAVAMIAMAGAASAQSVLERVLAQIDNSTNLTAVNGTFANIAENIGSAPLTYVGTGYGATTGGEPYTVEEYNNFVSAARQNEISNISTSGTGPFTYNYNGNSYSTYDAAEAAAVDYANADIEQEFTSYGGASEGIDASIANVISGVTEAVAEASQQASAGSTVAYQFDLPTYDIGALSTTGLGAVNTGDITLGVNSTVDDAKTSTVQAVSSVMAQLGGSADTGAIVLNVASNMTGVNASISNTMSDVNGALASASTTALGAVNTGTIVSGVNAAVQGIVGTSGQTNGL